MKKLVFCLILSAFRALLPAAKAAEAAGTRVLFDAKANYPTQGGPGAKYISLPTQSAVLVGGVGGLLVGERWNVGVASYSLASEVVVEQGGVKRDLGFSYGGLSLGASFFPRRLSYLNVAVLVGGGQAWAISRQAGATRDVATFALVEPEFSWFINMTHEVRLSLGLSLRFTGGADLHSVIGSELSGPAASLTLLYGKL